ncbi:MAG: ABC-F family ATP-binding cassette domain-containing protein [Clostridia bacterium]
MAVLSVKNIKKSFGTDVIIEDINFELQKGEHIGLVGTNGCGKTTLFKILCGKYDSDTGEFFTAKNSNIGYMEQHVVRDVAQTAYREVLSVFSDLEKMENELETLNHAVSVAKENLPELIEKQVALTEKFVDLGGLTYKNRVKSALTGLGFSESQIYDTVSVLSGGQKGKLQLAKMLLGGANILLLDEPTNHLDIDATQWLEDFLKTYQGAFIVISHDRYFLDAVTTKTFEIYNHKLTSYKGNYTAFVAQKAEQKLALQRVYEGKQKEISRIEGIIEQQKRFNQARNYITIAHKQKSIDRLEEGLEKPEEEPDSIDFQFKASGRGGNEVLIAEDIALSFGDNKLFENVNFLIKRQDRIFLLGPNGCGKTSLLKVFLDIYTQTAGEFRFGSAIDVGYYDQAQGNLNDEKTVIDEIWDEHPQMTQTQIRNALAVFLFRNEDVFKPIKGLSGGERARVLLLKLMLQKSNFLVLDEPTNHLDITSREALEDALLGYDGTLFVVSHDRYLINKLSSKIMHLTKTGIDEYIGNYDDYLEAKDKRIAPELAKKVEKVNTYKQNKEKLAEIRKAKSALSRCEKEIETNENETELINEQLSLEENISDYVKTLELTEKLHNLEEDAFSLMEKWEELHAFLENMNKEEE